jgi:hypothetical protein
MRIFSSAEYVLRVLRLISRTLLSTPSLWLIAHSFGPQITSGASINKILDSVPNALTPNICPACGKHVSFKPLPDRTDYTIRLTENDKTQYIMGHRICPDESCFQHIAFVQEIDHALKKSSIVAIWPSSRLLFDTSKVPQSIQETFEEAVSCHAEHCYRAAAMMIRRTIEEVCGQQGITGAKLYEKIEGLKQRQTLSPALVDAMHAIRWLGNDAAHIEARTYEEVGHDEVELAIQATSKILEFLYQVEDLVGKLVGRTKDRGTNGGQNGGQKA